MTSPKDDAERLALLLAHGFSVEREVLDFAFPHLDDPVLAPVALEIVDARHPRDIAHWLRAFPGDVEVELVTRSLFRWFLDLLRRDPASARAIARALQKLAIGEYLAEGLASPCYGFYEAFTLAENGFHGSFEFARADLVDFLEREASPDVA